MRLSCVVLLLAASIVAAAAAERKPTFEDWLAGPKAGIAGGAKPSEDYYGQLETVDTCLRAIKKSGCTTSPPPSYVPVWGIKTFRWALGCCDTKHYGDYNKEELSHYLEKPVEVGQCQFQEFNTEDEMVSGDKIIKNATFLAQCTLNDKSDSCGHPFCDKQVLTIVGSKYTIKDAIVSAIPTAPSAEGSCAEAGLMSAKPAYDEYEHKEYDHDHKFYKVKRATLYHGTMTINSRLHDIKFEDGTFQFVNYIDLSTAPVEATHAEVKDAYVLDPYKVELSYFKTKGY